MKKLYTVILLLLGLNVGAQQTIELCPNVNTTFTYNSDAGIEGTYTWVVESDIFVGNPFTYTWKKEGQYKINLSFTSEFGCIDTLSYDVIVIPCENTYMYAPNTFSPNGDGLNDVFNFYGYNYKNAKLFIYNRWGDLIYQSDGTGWDGTYGGSPCQQDVYVYMVQWYDSKNKLKQIVGHLTLIK